jgi:L-ribulokinase
MSKHVIGLDFGTNSCRSLIIDVGSGREVASHVFPYPSGKDGVIVDPADPNMARQNPADYVLAIEVTVKEALKKAGSAVPGFSPNDVIGIGVDTTGSSPMPVDANGRALCFNAKFKDDPAAMVWLWKDHTSYAEARILPNGGGARSFIAGTWRRTFLMPLSVGLRFVTGFLQCSLENYPRAN